MTSRVTDWVAMESAEGGAMAAVIWVCLGKWDDGIYQVQNAVKAEVWVVRLLSCLLELLSSALL